MSGVANKQPADAALRLEYEQTVQTLRNWDSIFSNAALAIIVGGGFGALGKEGIPPIYALGIVASCGYLLFVGYIYYNFAVTPSKFAVLNEIEAQLGMVGAYKPNSSRFGPLLRRWILPAGTLAYTTIMLVVLVCGR